MITITGVWKLVIVTISREYGALGRSVARGLADRLGYRLVDDDLPVVVAARLGTSPALVESVENRSSGFGERFLRSLGAGAPEAFDATVTDDDDLSAAALREMERLIREAADRDDAVIVGRGANVVLAGRPGLVRVFLRAPLDWRVRRVAESLAVDEATARAEIARVDGGRRAFAREHHDIEWGHPRAYDLVIDTSLFGAAGTVAILGAAVGARA